VRIRYERMTWGRWTLLMRSSLSGPCPTLLLKASNSSSVSWQLLVKALELESLTPTRVCRTMSIALTSLELTPGRR